jgi:hypothetical protein
MSDHHDIVHAKHLDEAIRLAAGSELPPRNPYNSPNDQCPISMMLLRDSPQNEHSAFIMGAAVGVQAERLRAAGAFAEEHLANE